MFKNVFYKHLYDNSLEDKQFCVCMCVYKKKRDVFCYLIIYASTADMTVL